MPLFLGENYICGIWPTMSESKRSNKKRWKNYVKLNLGLLCEKTLFGMPSRSWKLLRTPITKSNKTDVILPGEILCNNIIIDMSAATHNYIKTFGQIFSSNLYGQHNSVINIWSKIGVISSKILHQHIFVHIIWSHIFVK